MMAAVESCAGWKESCETTTASSSPAATALLTMAKRREYRRKLLSSVAIINAGRMYSVHRGASPEASKRASTAKKLAMETRSTRRVPSPSRRGRRRRAQTSTTSEYAS